MTLTSKILTFSRRIFVYIITTYVVLLAVYLLLRVSFGDRFWWLSLLNTFAHLLFLPLLILLPLAIFIRARQRILQMLPLALIGGMWFVPYYLPKSAVLPTGITIRVLTANVWGNNHDLSQIEKWIRETDADLVLLQEVSPAYATDRLPGLLDLYPHQFSQPDSTRWGGNITLSRYPIVSSEYIDLQTRDNPDPQRVVIAVGEHRIAAYNVHLAWPVGTPRITPPVDSLYMRVMLGFDDRIRNNQINNLLDHLKKEPYPYIVGGDFNTSDQSATYNRIAVQMIDSFRESGRGLGGSWPVSAARGLPSFLPPLIRIDYIWHSAGLRTIEARQGQPIGSDHLPVHATLEIIR